MATSPIARTHAASVSRRRRWAFAGVAGLIVVGAGAWRATEQRGADRQQLVAERGAAVMPFDLEATTHRFEPTSTGGIQSVVADDPIDTDQIDLVRAHLRREQTRFRAGDFGDPTTIHGEAMPGIAVLRARVDDLEITYRDVPAGGELTYQSSDRTVIDAVHEWFEAQLSDHGEHAQSSASL